MKKDRSTLAFIYFFAINDGGYDVGLCHLLNVVVQEIAVIHHHIGNLAELDSVSSRS